VNFFTIAGTPKIRSVGVIAGALALAGVTAVQSIKATLKG